MHQAQEVKTRVALMIVLYAGLIAGIVGVWSWVSGRGWLAVLGNLWIPIVIFLGVVVWQAVRGVQRP